MTRRKGTTLLTATQPIRWNLELEPDPADGESRPADEDVSTNRINLPWTIPEASCPDPVRLEAASLRTRFFNGFGSRDFLLGCIDRAG